MKVLVCGGRNFLDDEFVAIVLDRIHLATAQVLYPEGGHVAPGSTSVPPKEEP